MKTRTIIGLAGLATLAGITTMHKLGQEDRTIDDALGDRIAFVKTLGDDTVMAQEYDCDTSYYRIADGSLELFNGDTQGLEMTSFGFKQQLPGYVNLFEQSELLHNTYNATCEKGFSYKDAGCEKQSRQEILRQYE